MRSAAALVTAVGQSVSSPLRAVGLGLLANGAATHDEQQAVAGALLTVGLSAFNKLMGWVVADRPHAAAREHRALPRRAPDGR